MRVTALRRNCHRDDDEEAKNAKDIYDEYRENRELATKAGNQYLQAETKIGRPTSQERADLRRECTVQGPAGLRLESMHLQTAAVNSNPQVKQWNQPTIDILNVQQMCTRSHTRAMEGQIEETRGLDEIGHYATRGKAAEKI